MSPIDYIKEGITEGNWTTVCEGYERLTGQSLPIPFPSITIEVAEDALKKIADIVVATLDTPIAETCEKKTQTKKSASSSKKKNNKKKVKRKATVTEDGEDASLKLNQNDITPVQRESGGIHLITNEPDQAEIENNKIRAKKSSRNKLKLNRNKPDTYKVQCNECGQKFSSTRPSGEMGQKCKKCLDSLKSRFV